MKLSIIIPIYNERKTVQKIIRKVQTVKLPVAKKEIIIVDDGSTDGTKDILKSLKIPNTSIFFHKKNQGKGAAVITGLSKAKGEYVIIQDADLEYDPNDIKLLLKKLHTDEKHVVYGTRLKRLPNFKRDERTPLFLTHYLGNKLLSLLTSVLYGTWITDMECGYKLFPRLAFKNVPLRARGFELEPEITAKLLKRGYHISEVPISTNPRSHSEGKKLHAVHDGMRALNALIKYRFID